MGETKNALEIYQGEGGPRMLKILGLTDSFQTSLTTAPLTDKCLTHLRFFPCVRSTGHDNVHQKSSHRMKYRSKPFPWTWAFISVRKTIDPRSFRRQEIQKGVTRKFSHLKCWRQEIWKSSLRWRNRRHSQKFNDNFAYRLWGPDNPSSSSWPARPVHLTERMYEKQSLQKQSTHRRRHLRKQRSGYSGSFCSRASTVFNNINTTCQKHMRDGCHFQRVL